VHLIGVIAFWKLGLHEQYSTEVLGGALDIGEGETYVLGFAWLVVTVAYTVVGTAFNVVTLVLLAVA
jgi:hypothetical protein